MTPMDPDSPNIARIIMYSGIQLGQEEVILQTSSSWVPASRLSQLALSHSIIARRESASQTVNRLTSYFFQDNLLEEKRQPYNYNNGTNQ